MTEKVRKAILPVAGLGTRMLPATKSVPKEMLPIVDKPIIQYIVREAYDAGIREIILVTSSQKSSIENYFDDNDELESTLEQSMKNELLDDIRAICPADLNILQVRQGSAKGLGHAIFSAKAAVDNEPVAILLPDVLIEECRESQDQSNLGKMIEYFNETGLSQVMVEKVAKADVKHYGIVDVGNQSMQPGDSAEILAMVEKPKVDEAPSNLAITGRYIVDSAIWQMFEDMSQGVADEFQFTDTLAAMLKERKVQAFYMQGVSFDCGSKLGYMKAMIKYGLEHEELGLALTDFVKQVCNE